MRRAGRPVDRYGRAVKRLILLAAALALVGVAAAAYVRVGWSRMETTCSAEPPGEPTAHRVSYDWSWDPPGFRCTDADGRVRTSLWF